MCPLAAITTKFPISDHIVTLFTIGTHSGSQSDADATADDGVPADEGQEALGDGHCRDDGSEGVLGPASAVHCVYLRHWLRGHYHCVIGGSLLH